MARHAHRLLICIAPVRDPRHIDGSGGIVNDVNDPVIADTNPPFLIAALEFFASGGPGIGRQIFETRNNAGNQLCGQPAQFFLRACP